MTSLSLTFSANFGATISDGVITYFNTSANIYEATGFTTFGGNCPNVANLISVNSATGTFVFPSYYFQYCGSLTSINLSGATISELSQATFGNCDNLTTISWPQGLIYIGNSGDNEGGVFDHCNSLLNVVVPDTVTTIRQYSFEQNSPTATNVLTYTINSNVTTMPAGANINQGINSYIAGNVILNTDSATSAAAIYFSTFFPSVTINVNSPPVICFKEGSKILTDKGYIAVQDLRNGDLVKTVSSGFKKVEHIGYSKMYHNANDIRSKDKLYKCCISEYPELTEDLVITGCHSILIKNFKDHEQIEKTQEVLGKIYITETYYRLPACVDDRTKIFEEEGVHTIWHFSLEHSDYYMNYGVYANGLLVETTSNRMMVELSGMTLV